LQDIISAWDAPDHPVARLIVHEDLTVVHWDASSDQNPQLAWERYKRENPPSRCECCDAAYILRLTEPTEWYHRGRGEQKHGLHH
jgi:hypothetical protein